MSVIEELEGEALSRLLGSEPRGVLVDFWSPWCAPCRTMRPHLKRLAEERDEDWRFVAVNAQSHLEAAGEFEVRTLPTLIFFRQGEEAFRFAGAAPISSIAEKLDELSRPN